MYRKRTAFALVLFFILTGKGMAKNDCRTDIDKAFDGSFASSAIQMRHLLLYTPVTCGKKLNLHNGGFSIDNGWSTSSGYVSRYGYEIAFPWFLMESVHYETDYQSYHAFIFMINVSTPQVLLLPMFSFGVGVPVDFQKGTRAGIRLQAGLQLFLAGFYYSFDVYPGGKEYVSTFMGRISF